MADDQKPKQTADEDRPVKLSDLKAADLSKLPATARMVEDLASYRAKAEGAFGSVARDMQKVAERHRALVEAPVSVSRALAQLSATPDMLSKARLVPGFDIASALRPSAGLTRIMEEHNRITSGFMASAKSLERLQAQIQPPTIAQLGFRAVEVTALRAADPERFTMPAAGALAAQFKGIDPSHLFPTSRLLGVDFERTVRAAEAIRTPWIEATNAAASLARFAELESLGRAIRLPMAYSDEVAGALRASLGDWRDPITRDVTTLSELSVRTEFYIERGLNRDLTDLPEDAFEDSLDVTEIRTDPPPLVALYGLPVVGSEELELEAGFLRNNQAHNWLQRFETQLRRFIDEQMTVAFGEKWPERRLPNNMLDRWLEKQKKDPNRDRHSKIIIYSDFTDYELIICKRDNFKEVFSTFFNKEEHFRESMQRLAVPRIEVMHARIITQDDELYLFAELRRLTNQIMRRH
ncbi:Swt1 family HEPN domain-containing protein [Methylobacterium sp. SD21]|uniref:Swt1 family HEPN domain-containing protein n=1 Tax=Methylobacterium litchii TaxID=3138810 RepID=UPI00313B36D2